MVLASTCLFPRKLGFSMHDTSSHRGWPGGRPQLFLLSLGQCLWTLCSNSAGLLANVPVAMMQALAVGRCLHCDWSIYSLQESSAILHRPLASHTDGGLTFQSLACCSHQIAGLYTCGRAKNTSFLRLCAKPIFQSFTGFVFYVNYFMGRWLRMELEITFARSGIRIAF